MVAKPCFTNGFQRIPNNRRIFHDSLRDPAGSAMFYLYRRAESFVFPVLSIVRHSDSWVHRRGPQRCLFWHLLPTPLKTLIFLRISKVYE